MKKPMMYILQLISLFVFIILLLGIVSIIKEIVNKSEEGLAYNLGYGLAGILVIALLFWLNIKLFKFSNKGNQS